MERDPFVRWYQNQASSESVESFEAPMAFELEVNPVNSQTVNAKHGHRIASFFAMIALGVFVSYFGGYNQGFEASQPEMPIAVSHATGEDQLAALVNFTNDNSASFDIATVDAQALIGSIGQFTDIIPSSGPTPATDYSIAITASPERSKNGLVKFFVTVNSSSERSKERFAVTIDFGDGEKAMKFGALNGSRDRNRQVTLSFSHRYTEQRLYEINAIVDASSDANKNNNKATTSIQVSKEPGPVSSITPSPVPTPAENPVITRIINTFASHTYTYKDYNDNKVASGLMKVWYSMLPDSAHFVAHTAFGSTDGITECPRIDDVYEIRSGGLYRTATFNHANGSLVKYPDGMLLLRSDMQFNIEYPASVSAQLAAFAKGTGQCVVGDIVDQAVSNKKVSITIKEDSDWAPLVGTTRKSVKGIAVQTKITDAKGGVINERSFYYEHPRYGFMLIHTFAKQKGDSSSEKVLWDRRLTGVSGGEMRIIK